MVTGPVRGSAGLEAQALSLLIYSNTLHYLHLPLALRELGWVLALNQDHLRCLLKMQIPELHNSFPYPYERRSPGIYISQAPQMVLMNTAD